MDPSCFTTAQRLSCKMMNPDLFKPSPDRPQAAAAKPNRIKAEHVKTELAHVVVDAKTGRSYCKGKLLGKVRRFNVACMVCSGCRSQLDGCTRTTGPVTRPVCLPLHHAHHLSAFGFKTQRVHFKQDFLRINIFDDMNVNE